jgi:hypothetical protein
MTVLAVIGQSLALFGGTELCMDCAFPVYRRLAEDGETNCA